MKLVKIGQYKNENTYYVSILEEARKAEKGYYLSYKIVQEGILTKGEAKAIAQQLTEKLEKELAFNTSL